MTIQEAINSGRPVRRKAHEALNLAYGEIKEFTSGVYLQVGKFSYHLTLSDLLADDWEVRSARTPLTKEDFRRAVSEALNGVSND